MPSIGGVIRKLPAPVKQVIKDQVYPQLLPEGETAPEFQLQNHDDSWHRLKKRWSILVFYPGDDTPGCTKQLQSFQEHYAQLQALGCEVYAINPAEAPSHKAFAEASQNCIVRSRSEKRHKRGRRPCTLRHLSQDGHTRK